MIVRFYHNLMPAKDWQPDSMLAAETGGYVFTRGNQNYHQRRQSQSPTRPS